MNITVTQNNTNIEWVTSNIIKKMYQLAIDPNNTVSYSGYLKSTSGYASQVEYLNNTFGPGLKIEASKHYLEFKDSAVEAVLAKYFGDGTGCTTNDLSSITSGTFEKKIDNKTAWQILNENNTPYAFPELQYFTGMGNDLLFYMMGSQASTDAPTGANDIILPYNLTTVGSYRFKHYKNVRRLRSNGKIRHLDEFAFQGCGDNISLTKEDYENGYGIVLDFSEMDATSFNQYSFCTIFYGDVILKSGIWDGTVHFQMPYTNIKKIVFPSDFDAKSLNFANNSSGFVVQRDYIFLGTTPPQHFSTGWPTSFNINGSSGSYTFYFPNDSVSSYNNVGIGESSNSYTLSDYANISDDNKDELVSYGCTATGSTGNWTIKAPGEA